MFPKWLRQNRAQRWIWLARRRSLRFSSITCARCWRRCCYFPLAFAVVGSVILLLFLLDRGLYRALVWAQPQTARAAHWARHSWSLAGEFGKKQLHRFEQPAEH